jgi:hypothetical protein
MVLAGVALIATAVFLAAAVQRAELSGLEVLAMLIRPLRIIAALILMGTGLGLLGALLHTEGAMHGGNAVAKAQRSTIQAVPTTSSRLSHSRHS